MSTTKSTSPINSTHPFLPLFIYTITGYLYKKSNRMLNTSSTMFRRRWFVLHDNMLYWYKSSLEVRTCVRQVYQYSCYSAFTNL
jgi:hypothetical protein